MWCQQTHLSNHKIVHIVVNSKASTIRAKYSTVGKTSNFLDMKNVAPGGIRTRDFSFTTYNSNREVQGSNPSEATVFFHVQKFANFSYCV